MNEDGLTILSQSSEELADKIAKSNEMGEVKDLTQLFNLNQAKRNVYRLLKLNGLLDKIDDAIVERINKNPNLFNNSDLINYLNAVQNSIEKSSKLVSGVDTTPLIQINHNEGVQINVTEIDRESRQNVLNFLESVLGNKDVIEIDAVEVIPAGSSKVAIISGV